MCDSWKINFAWLLYNYPETCPKSDRRSTMETVSKSPAYKWHKLFLFGDSLTQVS